MNASTPPVPTGQFTAARIAEVLGRDVREVRRELEARNFDGCERAGGNIARTYLVSSLPGNLRAQLETLAANRGYDCPERLLTREAPQWRHPVPVEKIHPEEIERAKLRAGALEAATRAFAGGARPADEIRCMAAGAHRQAFGYEVAAATLDAIMRRAINRDNGRGEFHRWDLYLPDNPKGVKAAPVKADAAADFAHFEDHLSGISASAPTMEERAWIWTILCENLHLLIEAGMNPKAARCRLIKHAFLRAPWLSRSRNSLAKCFAEKWGRYRAGERFVRDKRPRNSGRRDPLPLTEQDQHKLIARALGGGVAQAWRTLLANGELSSGVVERYAGDRASKTYIPARIRELIAPKVEMLQNIHHGPRQAKLRGAYITRDWSGVRPGDWYQGDDCTLPVYYWEIDPSTGKPRAIRGQFLVMNDCRTHRVLGFALHSEQNYNARVIRGLILNTHDAYGLPRHGFYFERGMWQKSKIVTGGVRAPDELTTDDTEAGLKDFGIRFVHARLPRAKTVERILGLLQQRMELEPGYCGRNEQVEKFERLQRNLLLARAGKIEFSSFLLHRDVWAERLAALCDEYNAERQDGRLLAGVSPRAFWDEHFDFDNPLVRLGNDARYLLANHRRPLNVTRNGVCVQIGRERHWFRSEETGQLVGKTVQVYFNPEDMSSIWLRPDDDHLDAIVVPAAPSIPAMSAGNDELRDALAGCAAHNRAASTLYINVATHFPANARKHFRPTLLSSVDIERGREINACQAAIREARSEAAQQQKQLASYERRFGRMAGSDAVSPARQLAAMKLLEEAENEQ